jgi:hypothetical protein
VILIWIDLVNADSIGACFGYDGNVALAAGLVCQWITIRAISALAAEAVRVLLIGYAFDEELRAVLVEEFRTLCTSLELSSYLMILIRTYLRDDRVKRGGSAHKQESGDSDCELNHSGSRWQAVKCRCFLIMFLG